LELFTNVLPVEGLGVGVPGPAKAAVVQTANAMVVITREGKSKTIFFIGKLLGKTKSMQRVTQLWYARYYKSAQGTKISSFSPSNSGQNVVIHRFSGKMSYF
jgi:hypothetical protein